jgi:hypothetical protein
LVDATNFPGDTSLPLFQGADYAGNLDCTSPAASASTK